MSNSQPCPSGPEMLLIDSLCTYAVVVIVSICSQQHNLKAISVSGSVSLGRATDTLTTLLKK